MKVHPGLKHEQPEYSKGYEEGAKYENERCIDALDRCEMITLYEDQYDEVGYTVIRLDEALRYLEDQTDD